MFPVPESGENEVDIFPIPPTVLLNLLNMFSSGE